MTATAASCRDGASGTRSSGEPVRKDPSRSTGGGTRRSSGGVAARGSGSVRTRERAGWTETLQILALLNSGLLRPRSRLHL